MVDRYTDGHLRTDMNLRYAKICVDSAPPPNPSYAAETAEVCCRQEFLLAKDASLLQGLHTENLQCGGFYPKNGSTGPSGPCDCPVGTQ